MKLKDPLSRSPSTRQEPPTTAPGETYKLGAFLSRLLSGAGRRVLGALPARHLAFPAAAKRGGGGVGGPGGGALLRVVQPRPVPIHLSPQLWGTERRRPQCEPQDGSSEIRGGLAFLVPPPAPSAQLSPTAAAGVTANTSENSRHRGPLRTRQSRAALSMTPRDPPFPGRSKHDWLCGPFISPFNSPGGPGRSPSGHGWDQIGKA